ncbi:MAG: hypothetical protein IPL32_20240 [Chloracidobacterium sp.]|nr:hypothetical protein [Chloracidobacterium sp.]
MSELTKETDLLEPIIGIENRTPLEVFDMMCARIKQIPPQPAWHPIESEADLPKVGDFYLWQFRSNGKWKVHYFTEDATDTLWWFANEYIAWQKIEPYQRAGGSDE